MAIYYGYPRLGCTIFCNGVEVPEQDRHWYEIDFTPPDTVIKNILVPLNGHFEVKVSFFENLGERSCRITIWINGGQSRVRLSVDYNGSAGGNAVYSNMKGAEESDSKLMEAVHGLLDSAGSIKVFFHWITDLSATEESTVVEDMVWGSTHRRLVTDAVRTRDVFKGLETPPFATFEFRNSSIPLLPNNRLGALRVTPNRRLFRGSPIVDPNPTLFRSQRVGNEDLQQVHATCYNVMARERDAAVRTDSVFHNLAYRAEHHPHSPTSPINLSLPTTLSFTLPLRLRFTIETISTASDDEGDEEKTLTRKKRHVDKEDVR